MIIFPQELVWANAHPVGDPVSLRVKEVNVEAEVVYYGEDSMDSKGTTSAMSPDNSMKYSFSIKAHNYWPSLSIGRV